jgi:hypothetical protein
MSDPICKSDLLTPGTFTSLPLAVLAADLTPSAKLIYAAILNEIRTGADAARIPLRTLGRMTGCGRSTVVEALAHLVAAGFLRVETAPGRPAVYRLLAPAEASEIRTPTRPKSVPVTAGDPSEIRTPTRPESVPVTAGDPSEIRTPTRPKSGPVTAGDPSEIRTTPVRNPDHPPSEIRTTPVRIPDGTRPDSGPHSQSQRQSTPSAQRARANGSAEEDNRPDAEAMLARVARIYAEAYPGLTLPDAWTDPLIRAYANAERSIIDAMTASDIRAGRSRAERTGGTPGLGWVLKATRLRLESAAGRRAASAEPPRPDPPDAEAYRRRKADLLDRFRRAPEPARQRHLDAAATSCPRASDAIREQIAAASWAAEETDEDRQPQPETQAIGAEA